MSHAIVSSRSTLLTCLFFALLLGSAVPSESQGYNFNYNLAVNSPTFTTAEPVEMGFINVANGNLHIEIPIAGFKQRGPLSYNARLIYDSRIWQVVTGSSQIWQPTNIPNSMAGWRFVTGGEPGTVTWSAAIQYCDDEHRTPYTLYTGFSWTDPYGNKRLFAASTIKDRLSPCDYDQPTADGPAQDSSGYHIYITNYTVATVYAPDGTQVYPSVQDSNGNYFSKDGNGNIIDTLGLTPVTVTSGTNTVTYAVVNPQGTRSNYVVTTAAQNYNTAFGQGGITESSGSITAVTNLALPDGTYFSFQYDSGTSPGNYAELKSMTLPTGAVITFGATTFNDAYGNRNRWINSRTVNNNSWQYTPSVVISCQSSNCWQKVVVTKPTTETVTYNFFLNNGAWPSSVQYSNTSAGAVTVANTWSTCGTCGPASNVVKQTATTTVSPNPFVSGKDVIKSVQYTYSDPTNGLLSEVDEADFGAPGSLSAGPVLRKTLISYATLNGNNMINRPYQITTKDGSNTTYAQTTYSYDQTGTTSTTNTPNHNSVTVARGNPTTVSQWVSSSSSLYKTFSYYDTGLVSTVEENGLSATTSTYLYNQCYNSYISSVTMPLNLTGSYVWNCNGGVITQVTDENSQVTKYTYGDPNFWRLTATTDPLSNTTNTSYTPTTAESALTFNNGNSTVDLLSTVDNLGRPLLAQRRQAPSVNSFDTTLYAYDALGQIKTTSLPYSGAAGYQNTSAPYVTTGYNAAGQPISASDLNGLSISYTYSQNDELAVTGPAPPPNENVKQRQFEYDGLGRLTSVCELTTTGTGSGTCAQNNAATGYWTKYTYNPLDNLIGVTQNAQALSGSQQIRTYTYDGLGRLTSEANPETGATATTYTYDSISSGNCSGTSEGDKIKRVDPAGNVSCYTWDALHRLTSITYPSGPNATNMPGKYYVYDWAQFWGFTLTNPVGRLTEAYTWLNGTTYSAEAFSYDALGVATDFYEATPHGGSWYHVQQAYFANGMLETLQGFKSTGTTSPLSDLFTYNLDGEGRPNGMTDTTTSTSVWNSTSYNAASQPLVVTPSAGGTETFTYDGNSGRMSSWTSTANPGSQQKQQIGTPTWNANGTLQNLQINDSANVGNTQNCGYRYDDLMRVASVNCGASIWQQNFSYDAFGNITKTVPQGGTGQSFNLGYNPANNNHVTGFSYDGMSNVTNDGADTYSYNAEGRQITVNGNGTTFDAFNRAFEIQIGSNSYTQVVYSPSGQKFAFMNGQTLLRYVDPMVAGMAAVHNGDGTSYFQHADWLGSSRWGQDGSGNVTYDRAYAPFGEIYAELNGITTDRDFTGQTQDTVNGIYDFLFRQQSPAQGRWLVPDPAGLAAVDITNPQTWNRYAYVANNPLSFIDPLGLLPPGSCDPKICANGNQNDDFAVLVRNWICGMLNGLPAPCTVLISNLFSGGAETWMWMLTRDGEGSWGMQQVLINPIILPISPAANNSPFIPMLRLVPKSDYCGGGDRYILYWVQTLNSNNTLGAIPSTTWYVTEQQSETALASSNPTERTDLRGNQFDDWISGAGQSPVRSYQTFTVAQSLSPNATSYSIMVRIGNQDYGTLGVYTSNPPIVQGVQCPASLAH